MAVLIALGAVVVFFFLDILQRLWAAVRIKRFMEEQEAAYFHEKGVVIPGDQEVQVPRTLDRPIYLILIAKTLFLLSAFFMLAVHIILLNLTRL